MQTWLISSFSPKNNEQPFVSAKKKSHKQLIGRSLEKVRVKVRPAQLLTNKSSNQVILPVGALFYHALPVFVDQVLSAPYK